MSTPKRIYLAGPEVFLPQTEHASILKQKLTLLQQAGFEGVDPLDTKLEFGASEAPRERGFRIYRANQHLMDSCDAIIANLTPFRGISADPGTVFEVGYMIGQGKPACGFTGDARRYYQRAGSTDYDQHGHAIENFDLEDNLMISCGIVEAGGVVAIGNSAPEHPFFCSQAFKQCLEALRKQFR
ncbi:nucleoside 2-deoxyribosyltransferase [Marinobacter sp. F4216]|uniref:nucleoside 2-deoxyribosyltransferase n=1 Tax=Marinobacter sp. F4216 TaxID=2874281 RepID=UPI001CBFE121|nr:nucleoside 2-deoxyribosyltransferase [Marinobacter sp. F4216]MBZ2168036.1 nucleoside 2-deoxyribosyltransferase [Marinobacter sp. F4216]